MADCDQFDGVVYNKGRGPSIITQRAYVKPSFETTKSPHLLSLPAELLQKVYHGMLGQSPKDHLSFLCTCRKIWYEGRATFLSRPLAFKSQAQLMVFTQSACNDLLCQVITIKFCLEDLDRSQVRQYLAQAAMGLSKRSSSHPYNDERDRIISALKCLPNLRSISILRPSSPDRNHAPRMLINEAVEWIARHLTELHHLRIDYDGYAFDNLASLTNLRTLQGSGFSRATPERAQRTVQQLENLRELHIVPAGYIMGSPYFKCQQPSQMITAGLIRSLRPLKALTLSEPPESRPEDHIFLTPSILKAVSFTHSASLEELNIRSLHALATVTLKVLSALLLSTTQLQTISLTFPQIPIDTLDALPPTTAALELLVSGPPEADAMLDRLHAQSHRLQRLKAVTFVMAGGAAASGAAAGYSESAPPIPVSGCDAYTTGGSGGSSSSSSSWPWAVRWGSWRPFADN